MSASAFLEIFDVSKSYGTSKAVDSVSLQVQEGEFVSFLGPSGSGKTTTLQMIAGFVQPDAGTIRLGDRDLTTVPPHKRDIGIVFQNYALFPHLTVAQNVAFPLKMRRVAASEIKARVSRALERVRLADFADRKPTTLSGGQQQRVALARAFVFEPRVLLMDEPLGALDKKLREGLQYEITEITHSLGITTIYVTHDQDEALAMSDRIAIYNDGAIEQIGTGRDLYEKPASLFVATFMGDSNVIPGSLVGTDGAIATAVGQLDGRPAPSVAGSGDGVDACLLVRPENIALVAPAKGGVGVECTVESIVYLGASQRVRVTVPGLGPLTVAQDPSEGLADLHPGQRVRATWRPTDAVTLLGSPKARDRTPAHV